MRIYLISIGFLFICSNTLYAQYNQFTFSLNVERKLVTKFFIREVRDERIVKRNVGIVKAGLLNERSEANFDTPFVSHLESYFNAVLEPSDSVPLIAVVNEFSISERTTMFNERARCEISISFLFDNGDNEVFLSESSAISELKSAVDITSKHSENSSNTILDCIGKFSQTEWKSLLTSGLESIREKPYAGDSILSDGLFYSFNELINNRARLDLEFDIKSTKQSSDRFIIRSKKGKRIKNLYAIRKNGRIYLNASAYTLGEYFVQAHLTGRFILFRDLFSSTSMEIGSDPMNAMANSPTSTNIDLYEIGLILDFDSGMITLLTMKNMETLLALHPELLSSYKKSKKRDWNQIVGVIATLNEINN